MTLSLALVLAMNARGPKRLRTQRWWRKAWPFRSNRPRVQGRLRAAYGERAEDVALFDRLAADRTLPAPLRARAQRRRAMAHYKLAVRALREGDPRAARARLPHAWLFPGRALPVLAAWGVSLLPAGVLGGLRRQTWATRGVGRRMLAQRRVVLRGAERRAP